MTGTCISKEQRKVKKIHIEARSDEATNISQPVNIFTSPVYEIPFLNINRQLIEPLDLYRQRKVMVATKLSTLENPK
jgi:hypothetical protein